MIKYSTYMWREVPEIVGDKIYRFQTNDSKVNRKMRKRKDFELTLNGINTSLWVYRTRKYSLKEAKKTLMRITNQNIDFDSKNEVFFANSGVIMTPSKQKEPA